MKIIGVIPARYASTRFPGKPLVDIQGRSMVMRVYDQAMKGSLLAKVVVATDHLEIFDHVLQSGGNAVMTREFHQSGTERCAEVHDIMGDDMDAVINIQGDEPFIDPLQIDSVARCLMQPHVRIATLVAPIKSLEDLDSPHVVKAVLDVNRRALLFSRLPIPYCRDAPSEMRLMHNTYYRHIGIYGYRADVLREIVRLPFSSLEKAESLEQLRWMQNGYSIHAEFTDEPGVSIDTPEDLKKLSD
jgi:3-deoxy-manno-octulosonate cytidylyltransferase (CMP-KDO synthetase)